jgi:hypothetical protein
MRHEFLVVYDYDTGGAWAYVRAESAAQIGAAFPELAVVDHRPDWLSADVERSLRETMTVDIDDRGHPLLAAIERRRGVM